MLRSFAPLVLGTALFSSGFAQYPGSVPPPAILKKGFDAITVAQAKELLGYLAGPETEGRGTGQPGFQKAADFVAARFRQWGLKPVGDRGTYFQHLTFYRHRPRPGSLSLQVAGGSLRLGERDIALSNLTGDTSVTAPVVLLRTTGGALSNPGTLDGKIVIVAGEAQRRLRSQILGQNPAALFFISAKPYVSSWTVRRRPDAPAQRPPQGTITPVAANRLLEALEPGGTSLLEGPLDPDTTTIRSLDRRLRLSARIEDQRVRVPNVLGLIEGSDPTLKHEVVGIGAHLDHLGIANGEIHYGADDDGSGSTALLQIAHAISVNPVKPRRSILFLAFCGEEMGLLGSAYYADNPVIPHNRMIAELQMDMVGRDSDGEQNGDSSRVDKASENTDTMRLVGSKRISQDLHDLILSLNRHTNFRFKYDAEDVYTRSDHYNFAKHGIPIAFLFDGFHPDYHQPTDTIEKINWLKLTTAARLYYLTAYELANRTERPRKNGSDQK